MKKITKKQKKVLKASNSNSLTSIMTRYKAAKEFREKAYNNKEWYTIRAILGNQWANFFVLSGARQRGKTCTVEDYALKCWHNPDHPLYHVPFYWMRLNDIAVHNMLMNNGAKMFEPILVGRYHLEDIKVRGDMVYHQGIPLCFVWGLSVAYNNKGSAIFSADTFNGCNIIVDEIALEKNQRKTFDVCYNLRIQTENITRHKRENVKIFFMLNNTQDCPEILALFNFIPLEFGVYKLAKHKKILIDWLNRYKKAETKEEKKALEEEYANYPKGFFGRRAVIEYIPNNIAYEKMRSSALVNDLQAQDDANFTNKVIRDIQCLNTKGRLLKPTAIIKFTKDPNDWFTVWDNSTICKWNNEKPKGNVKSIAMRRGLDSVFLAELRDWVIAMEDIRQFKYRSIVVQTRFRNLLLEIKK